MKHRDRVITRLEPLRSESLQIRVHLDRGEPLVIALEAVERMKLGVGDPLPSNVRHHLLNADAEAKILEAARDLLTRRARTRAELRRKLIGKGFRPARVDPCLARLEERGLLDDAAAAAAFVRDRIRHRPRGRGRLAQELRAKGVGDSMARTVVDAVMEDEALDEPGLAQRVAEEWLKRQGPAVRRALGSAVHSPEREKARRRLYQHLCRRGFAGQALADGLELARRPGDR